MSEENVEMVRRSLTTFLRGDWDSAGADFAPDVVWEETASLGPDAATYRGTDDVRAALEKWTDMWSAYRFEISDVIGAGENGVVALLRESGRGQSSDVTVEREIAEIHTISNGKISHVRLYGSWAEALKAAGLPA